MNQALTFKRAQQTAEIAGIEFQHLAQIAQVIAVASDLMQQPRLPERAATCEVALVERANAPRDGTIESPDQGDRLGLHSLTTVREFCESKKFRTLPPIAPAATSST